MTIDMSLGGASAWSFGLKRRRLPGLDTSDKFCLDFDLDMDEIPLGNCTVVQGFLKRRCPGVHAVPRYGMCIVSGVKVDHLSETKRLHQFSLPKQLMKLQVRIVQAIRSRCDMLQCLQNLT